MKPKHSKIVTIPRTNHVFLRESIVGVSDVTVVDAYLVRYSKTLCVTIYGVGFESHININIDVPDELYQDSQMFELMSFYTQECDKWHAEVVDVVFGDTYE